MTTTIRFRVQKDIDAATERKILKLKGSLIAQSFTDIIHFEDDGEEFYIHHFITASEKKHDAINYISSIMTKEALTESVSIL